jgi:hypothetical protein
VLQVVVGDSEVGVIEEEAVSEAGAVSEAEEALDEVEQATGVAEAEEEVVQEVEEEVRFFFCPNLLWILLTGSFRTRCT